MISDSGSKPLHSFWMGGFECADHLNIHGNRVDLLTATRHLTNIDHDYQELSKFDIKTVREGICWSRVERKPGQYDFSHVRLMIESGKKNNIQQIWDLCHFGYPDDLTPLHPHFCKRFVALCKAFVGFYLEMGSDTGLIVTPVNEVSFLSWLGGEAAGTSPYCVGMGWHIKYALIKAFIEGVKAMKALMPDIRILTTEPLVNMVPPLFHTPAERMKAEVAHLEQYQALDMLMGHICPELGGTPDLIDILGFNFYYNNQWIHGSPLFLPWLNDIPDPRWRNLHDMLTEAYLRYQKPVMITETSHPGEDRPAWIKFIADQCAQLLSNGIPLCGVCLYPIIDRPDWDHLHIWHQSGLWDEIVLDGLAAGRTLNLPYAAALLGAQALVAPLIENTNIIDSVPAI